MTASKRWALVIGLVVFVIGLVVFVLGLAGVTAWWRKPVDMTGAPGAPVGFAAAPQARVTPPPPDASAPAKAAALSPSDAPAVAPPAAVASPTPTPVPPPAPHFDIVRVEPSGDTVVAGKGQPNAKVALLAQGAVVAEATTDAGGSFVMLPKALQPGDHSLSLRQTTPAGASTSDQSVTVVVPERGKGSVVVALAEPGQPTKVLSAPDAPPPAPVATPVPPAEPKEASKGDATVDPNAKVAVRAVDLEHEDGFHASGAAAPGTPVTIYLNNAHIADVIAGPDGQWTVTIKKGLAGGHYVVRADAGPAPKPAVKAQADSSRASKPQVTARAEVPFDVPVSSVTPPDARRPARSDVAVATPTAAGTGNAGNAVIDEIQTARVVDGDNLWNISLSRLGQATRYTQIYAANEKQIRDPNLIYPGQVFVLPR